MNFLLDTNVVSEWMKPRPDAGVVAWLEEVDEDRVHMSVVTLAELRYGVDRLADGKRRRQLERWLEHELPLRFEGRVLSIDRTVADACGKIVARSARLGRPMEAMDAFLAATAEVYHLTLVTRNISDFRQVLKSVVNPWSQQ